MCYHASFCKVLTKGNKNFSVAMQQGNKICKDVIYAELLQLPHFADSKNNVRIRKVCQSEAQSKFRRERGTTGVKFL